VTVFLSSLGGWAFMAHNDSPVARGLQAQERPSLADQEFARRVAQTGMAEIKLSELAAKRGFSSAVRSFSERLVAEYTTATNQLRNATAKDSITLPDEVSPEDQNRYAQLSRLNGRAFDRAYVESIVEIDQNSLPLLQTEAKAGRSERIKNYAAEAVSTAEEQLHQARQILQNVTP
jgi:putative membrane protein